MTSALNPKQRRHGVLSTVAHTILALVVLLAIGMVLFQSYYIYPQFIKLTISNTEREAIRTGRHLMRVVMKDYTGSRLLISEETDRYLNTIGKDYGLWKIKIFGAAGETVFSTSGKDVGKINKHRYFHEIVAKGIVHTKVVQKNTKSLEGQMVSNDVVETYIPILDKGEFIGAFELYYNISIRKAALDAIIARTNFLLYSLSAIIVLAAIVAGFGIRRGMMIRKQYEEALYAGATRDPLTGLYNRRRFNELMQWEVDKFIRYRQSASLLMVDIDHFKKVNDTHGHQAGDDVLVAVANAFKSVLRESDFVARYGGEEFVVHLPDTGRKGASGVAEKLRQTVKATSTPNAAGPIQVTVSIGVVDFAEVEDISFEKVIREADNCLYWAKDCGRDRICTSEDLEQSRESEAAVQHI